MEKRKFTEATSLVIVANQFPDEDYRKMLTNCHPNAYFHEIYMRWDELFELLPEAKEIPWHESIDFPDKDLFYKTMRMVVESDATPTDIYADIMANTEGLTIRWNEFLKKVPTAEKVNWFFIAEKYCGYDDEEAVK